MLSTSESFAESPVSRLPYNILREIFTHCLPRYPLCNRQPDTRTAPILLCHVCSSWRTVALASTNLWAHLFYSLTITKEYDSPSCQIQCAKRDLEFIQWWKINHGPIPPFLSFSIHERQREEITKDLTGDTMAFFLEYITSAQYLELHPFYWRQIFESAMAGYQIAFPNLHTLLAVHAWETNYPFYHILQNHAVPALRRLSINEGAQLPPDDLGSPNNWSRLTHITLHVSISVDLWFSFIRAVPNLQWGYFDVKYLTNTDYTTPLKCTLLQLTTLFVGFNGQASRSFTVLPLVMLFTKLHLPSLRTLSLTSTTTRSWTDQWAIVEINGVLRSTPAITKLVLEDKFHSMHSHIHNVVMFRDLKPIWEHTTQLEHLHLTLAIGILMPEAEAAKLLDSFVRNMVSSDTTWLDLPNPACPIRSITMCDWYGIFDQTRDLIMSRIQKYTEKVPNVVFDITSDPAILDTAHVRNEWSARV